MKKSIVTIALALAFITPSFAKGTGHTGGHSSHSSYGNHYSRGKHKKMFPAKQHKHKRWF